MLHIIYIFLGEKCDIRFEVNLEQHLNKFEDILVLHLENGKDIFISVSGDCQRSCFTASISVLCRCSLPILLMSPEQLRLAVSNYCCKKKMCDLYFIYRKLNKVLFCILYHVSFGWWWIFSTETVWKPKIYSNLQLYTMISWRFEIG